MRQFAPGAPLDLTSVTSRPAVGFRHRADLELASLTYDLRLNGLSGKPSTGEAFAFNAERTTLYRTLDGAEWDAVYSPGFVMTRGITPLASGRWLTKRSDNGRYWLVEADFSSGQAGNDTGLEGPMSVSASIAEHDGVLVYGEYGASAPSTRIMRTLSEGLDFEAVYDDPTIRHWHSLARDPHTGHWWAMSGDASSECSIVRSTHPQAALGTWEELFRGTQDERGIGMVFTAEHVYYGTDALVDPARLIRVNKATLEREVIGQLPGPCYGTYPTLSGMVMHTSVEPGAYGNPPSGTLVWSDGERIEVLAEINTTVVGGRGMRYATRVDANNQLFVGLEGAGIIACFKLPPQL